METHHHTPDTRDHVTGSNIRPLHKRYGMNKARAQNKRAEKIEDRSTFRQSAMREIAINRGVMNTIVNAHNGLALRVRNVVYVQIGLDLAVVGYLLWRLW